MQPCHRSTLDTKGTYDDQSCCRIIAEALVGLPEDVTICIKPTHLCRAGWEKNDQNTQYHSCIDNAENGIKALMSIRGRIEVSAMKPDDWRFLWCYVDSCRSISEEDLTKRKKLDKNIEKFLKKINGELGKEKLNADELIFKALGEMRNCNKKGKQRGACFPNLGAVMEHVKKEYGDLGDEDVKAGSEFTFVFKMQKEIVKISWDKNTKVLNKTITERIPEAMLERKR